MAAKPKLSPEQWALIRTTWEADPREGYAWLVEAMGLDVSAPAVRKTAMRDGWTKGAPAVTAPAKGKVSLSRRKTITETMPETIEGADTDAQSPDNGDAMLSKDDQITHPRLTPKEERFVGEYLIDLNGTQAAIRVGCSANWACQIGTENRYSRKRLL